MLWLLEILRRDGRAEAIACPLPAGYYLENWGLVTEALGPFAEIRLVSDGGHTLTPVEGEDVVAWWRVEPIGVVRPSLRGAFALAESFGRENASKQS